MIIDQSNRIRGKKDWICFGLHKDSFYELYQQKHKKLYNGNHGMFDFNGY